MFNCKACARSLLPDVLAPSSRSLNIPLRHSSRRSTSWSKRSFETKPTISSGPLSRPVRIQKVLPIRDGTIGNNIRKIKPAFKPIPPEQDEIVAGREVFSLTSLHEELRWLGDPLKLAVYIKDILAKNAIEKACELVKLSSNRIECTVSWNHLIDWAMQKGKVQAAFALFNDMKKRGQKPDAYTFTILFRGLSHHTDYPTAVKRALHLYQSMSAPNCPVRPSIIHTNAVLTVCARARDTDAVLGIAAKLPVQGAGAPNDVTFLIILDAFQQAADPGNMASETGKETANDIEDDMGDDAADDMDIHKGNNEDSNIGNSSGEPFEKEALAKEALKQDGKERRHQLITQGKRVWGEVISRFQQGDLMISENLVCKMARLLTTGGSTIDCLDSFALFEQTMGIPCPSGYQEEYNRVLDKQLDVNSFDITLSKPPPSLESLDKFPDDENPRDVFNPLKRNPQSKPIAMPSNFTLTVVLHTCIWLKAIPWAQNYWGVLTDPEGPYRVIPDEENYYSYLRLLRSRKASKLALTLVTQMHQGIDGHAPIRLKTKAFRIVMSACVRDSKNKNVLETAGKLTQLMLNTEGLPDVKTLERHLWLIRYWGPQEWRTMMKSLRVVGQAITNLRSHLAYQPTPDPGRSDVKLYFRTTTSSRDLEEVVKLAAELIRVYDKVRGIAGEAMKKEDLQEYFDQHRIWCAWVKRKSQGLSTERWWKQPPGGTGDVNRGMIGSDADLSAAGS